MELRIIALIEQEQIKDPNRDIDVDRYRNNINQGKFVIILLLRDRYYCHS